MVISGRKSRILRRIAAFLVLAGVLCLLLLAGFETFIRPTLQKLLDYKCRTAAERIIGGAVFDRFTAGDDYSDIVRLTFDTGGRVSALTTDRAKINSLKALLNEAVNDGIERLGSETVCISAGTLTGISFLYGKGAELEFRIDPKGSAETSLKSSFESAGINQTIHSIILEVRTELSPMTPGFSETVNVSFDILLSQTVIVGEVPGSYSHIVLDEEHLSELADIDI